MTRIDFDERELIITPTFDQKENQNICNLLESDKCPTEQQRFEVIGVWTSTFNEFDWLSVSGNFSDYIESVIVRADAYEPEIDYESTVLFLKQNSFDVLPYGEKQPQSSEYTSEHTSDFFDVFNSDVFSILAKIDVDSETQKGYMSNFKITTVYGSEAVSLELDQSSYEEYNNFYK